MLTLIALLFRVLHLTNRYIACALFALALGSFAFGVALGVKAFKIITYAPTVVSLILPTPNQ